MSDDRTGWAPVVVSRTHLSDTWWRAQPVDLNGEWRIRLWRAVLGRGQAHRLQEGSRFLLARNREGRVLVAVADMTGKFVPEFAADRVGRALHGMVGWLSEGPPAAAEIPALAWLRTEGRRVAAECFSEFVRDVWMARDDLSMGRPRTSEYGPAPWPAAETGEAPPPPAWREGHVTALPEERAETLWAALASTGEPYVVVTGWPAAHMADLSMLTHLTAATVTAETHLPVPAKEDPRQRSSGTTESGEERGRASGRSTAEQARGEVTRRNAIPTGVKVAAGCGALCLLVPGPALVKVVIAGGAFVVALTAHRLIGDAHARLRAFKDATRPIPQPFAGTAPGLHQEPKRRKAAAPDTEELL
ncbi:hypothetical protein AB0K60_36365 [Thermopolyspora sp. NPDC052614]|uniref:hypothetical protein n=1 Tax=Thermopolyspora sp. NPDC052614 TaxID=3155682 RepID=UPI003430C1D7